MVGPFCMNNVSRYAVIFILTTVPFLSSVASGSASLQESRAIQSITGVIQDQVGAPIRGAQVSIYGKAGLIAQTATDTEGRFTFREVRNSEATLVVHALGFAELKQKWKPNSSAILIILEPAVITEEIVVTATRTNTRLGDVAASIRVLSKTELDSTAAVRMDDVLRQIPGFQLFRRSGSRSANPTSQGVSLRGVGASGASRSLVLADGIPLNDPFGGWVYWGRIPRESLSHIEVMRGGASDLYGTGALGGVIQLLTKPIDTPTLSFDISYGNQNTSNASLF
jgi:outer membrane receptor protein involved in Fe transport